MPELPEVQTVVTTLQPLVGARFGRVTVERRDIVAGAAVSPARFLQGRTIAAIRREAKRIIFDLGDGDHMLVHLGMTGRLVVTGRRAALDAHTHLRIHVVGGADELRFVDPRRFGGVWLLRPDTPRKGRGVGPIGSDPLTIALPAFRRLLGRSRQIKALLLDQQVLAGLGNIYADEALYRSRIHPLACAADLDAAAVRRLYRAMQDTLTRAIAAGGSTIRDYRNPNGVGGWFQVQHQAYGRTGAPCRRCRTPIERIRAAGRSSHICPACQPL